MKEKKTEEKTMEGLKTKVIDLSGKEVGSLDLHADLFGAPVSKYLVHDTVRWQRAKARSGTHSALTKREVSGGGKKPFKQKGTGNARAGSNTSPLWVGGGVSHGPKPRDYEFRLSKRARRQALAAVLSQKLKSGELIVVNDLKLKAVKTKEVEAFLGKIGVGASSATILHCGVEFTEGLGRASRNIRRVRAMEIDGVNVYDLLRHRFVVASKDAISKLEQRVSEKA